MYDLRDKSTCPSFDNLKTKEIKDLAKMLVKALEGQIEALKQVNHYDATLMEDLKAFNVKINKSYKKILEA